ncbi:MAG: hypothetical protein DCF19_08505 [Pseudanabaena frigida]|uniref:Uncharacterized protein n=1 Tax=Pseudanabaena frigida TaxID=945775 RepID=A0A2W4WJ27_9CYAN|nr:MAG: hypothetical protein DCF19_08505 [Pseudanabaena frigida]
MFEKIQLIATSLTIIVGMGIATISTSSESQTLATSDSSSVTFLCQLIDKTPNTIARISSKTASLDQAKSTQNISVIQWKRSDYSESNETPMERCTRVSKILQYYGNKGTLNYITYGDMDGKEVVCATTSEGSPCSLLIFTLEKDENPKQIVTDLRQIIQNPQILSSSGNNIPKTEVSSRWQNPYGLGVSKSAGSGGAVR